MTDEKSSAQGPVDPHGPGGIDAPAPPGGPQRTDAPAGPDTPGEPARDPGPSTQRVTRPADGNEPPAAHHDERDVPDDPERAAQLENAETSLDEPSDGSGGE